MPMRLWKNVRKKQGSDLHKSQNTGYHLGGEEKLRNEQVLLGGWRHPISGHDGGNKNICICAYLVLTVNAL